ncbi:Dynein heavy chain-like protein [Dissostichus eleginoides]|uniref:Dynein heavy chain-like protein n=1 Tax=Dissostichus eleginoides TaxID=100907 RepID=A0AAD9BV99_DISEL|nr:Dynein heavy chain-like protein [Dissostichus eleginoides]
MNAAPIVMDFDLKRLLLMKNCHPGNTQSTTCTSHSEKESDRIAVETLIGKVIFQAVREIEEDEEDGSEGSEEDEETVKVSSIDDDEEELTEDERAESENADIGMVDDKSLTENTGTAGEETSGEDSTTKPYKVETKKGG